MDTGQHAYIPALTVYSNSGRAEEIIVAGILGAAPDIIGAYGNFIKHDKGGLYEKFHSDNTAIWCALVGAIVTVVSMLVGFGFFLGIGILCAAAHIVLDRLVHREGMRWWVRNEGLWVNAVIWLVLCVMALYIVPIRPWFALMGAVWASAVCAYCYVIYGESK